MNADVKAHYDDVDKESSILLWTHNLSDQPMGGSFRMFDFLMDFEPRGLTLLHLCTETILHGSVAPLLQSPSPEGPSCRMGVALTNNRADLKRAKHQIVAERVTW